MASTGFPGDEDPNCAEDDAICPECGAAVEVNKDSAECTECDWTWEADVEPPEPRMYDGPYPCDK